ncbi:MAG TPA: type II secretion system F family protein [Oligoflexia bacterium]|nr:type II secretion system F family protein [Oligoflexia bacterium]HMP47085.1 type II secretion system F family protein [Oligoflexia bacterium]
MSNLLLYIAVAGFALLLTMLIVYFFFSSSSTSEADQSLRNLIQSQKRGAENFTSDRKAKSVGQAALLAASQGETSKKVADVNSPGLARRLFYARWVITPLQFRIIQLAVTGIVVGGVSPFVRAPLIFAAFVLTPIFVDSVLDRKIRKRFDNFDRDYPDFLMAFVSRIKSGMNSLTGLQAAASGFAPESILRAEVELMLERIRLGIPEDQAIGAFGETIPHPEIELFVQGLILSRRLGGNLSSTIERLAKQVRKRQEFRKKAVGAVALERSSGIMIALVMLFTLGAIGVTAPDLFKGALENDIGQLIFQGGATLSIFGFYVSNLITKIKI